MIKRFILLILFCFLPGCDDDKKFSELETKVKMIVFDFDGTIADTLPITIKCINKLSKDFGSKPIETADEIEAFRETSILELVKDRLGWKFYLLPGLIKHAMHVFKENKKDISFFDGAKDLMQLLATNYKLAIITSNTEEVVRQVLEKYGISKIISEIHSDSSIFGKHTVIKRFLEAHDLNPDEILYIGDEIRDIEACKRIGVKIISVTWGYNSKNALQKSEPTYLVDSYEELEKIINSATA